MRIKKVQGMRTFVREQIDLNYSDRDSTIITTYLGSNT